LIFQIKKKNKKNNNKIIIILKKLFHLNKKILVILINKQMHQCLKTIKVIIITIIRDNRIDKNNIKTQIIISKNKFD